MAGTLKGRKLCPNHFTNFNKPVTATSEKYQKVREGKRKKQGKERKG